MKDEIGRVATQPGSREPSPTVSALTGFDPSRVAARLADPEDQRLRAATLLATHIGYQFRVWRITKALTVDELAALAEVSPRVIRKIERGEYVEALRPLSDIAFALGVEITLTIRAIREDLREDVGEAPASGIEAAPADETPTAAQPEGQEPGPKGDARKAAA